jgi:hypothetical protein
MPDRRETPAFVSGRGLFGKVRGFIRTSLQVVFDPHVYETMRMRNIFADARRFAIVSCIVATPIIVAVGVAVIKFFARPEVSSNLFDWLAGMGVVTLVFLLLFGIVGVIAMASYGSRRSPRFRLAVVFFHSAWLLPVLLNMIIMGALFYWLEVNEHIRQLFPRTDFGRMCTLFLSMMAGLVMIGPVPILAFLRFTRGLRQVRFANA